MIRLQSADVHPRSRNSFKCNTSAISALCQTALRLRCSASFELCASEIRSSGVFYFAYHSGKNAVYRNHRVTPTKTNRLATIIVSLVRDQARFGFCQGNTLLTFRRRPRIPGGLRCQPIAPLLTLLAYFRGRSKTTPVNSILACTRISRRCSRARNRSSSEVFMRFYRAC